MDQDTKYAARLANVYFLKLLGTCLSRAMADVGKEKLPEDTARLLRALERQESLHSLHADTPKGDPSA